MYATPDSLQNEVDRQIADLLEQGIIEESDSPYAAPIVCEETECEDPYLWSICKQVKN